MRIQRSQGRTRFGSGVLLVVAATMLAVAPGQPEHGGKIAGHEGEPLQGPLPCPGEGVRIVDKTREITSIPLSGPITDIPEFHDCQHFIIPDSGVGGDTVGGDALAGYKYDSLYAIFAAFRLSSLLRDLVVSDVRIEGPSGQSFPAVPVATIYSAGGRYPALGIEPGFNCFFVYTTQWTGQQPMAWGAKVVPVGGADSTCLKPPPNPDPLAVGKTLEVKPSAPDPQFSDTDYPAVARWDWDDQHKQQYIGIKCGSAWCEVGDSGFTPSGPFTGSTSFVRVANFGVSPRVQSRITAIKGWYDAQILATVTPGGKLVPSRVHGVFIPNPALDTLSRPPTGQGLGDAAPSPAPGLGAFAGNWVHVASVVLTGGDYPKHGLKEGISRILVCQGQKGTSPGQCTVPAQVVCAGNAPWWMRIEPDNPRVFAQPVFRCVKRTDHEAALGIFIAGHPGVHVDIPGTTRWRWLIGDEVPGWFKCPTYVCCTPS